MQKTPVVYTDPLVRHVLVQARVSAEKHNPWTLGGEKGTELDSKTRFVLKTVIRLEFLDCQLVF